LPKKHFYNRRPGGSLGRLTLLLDWSVCIFRIPHFTHHSAFVSTVFDSAFYFPHSAFRNSAFYQHPFLGRLGPGGTGPRILPRPPKFLIGSIVIMGGIMAYMLTFQQSVRKSITAPPRGPPLGCRHVYFIGNACSAKTVMGHSTGLR